MYLLHLLLWEYWAELQPKEFLGKAVISFRVASKLPLSYAKGYLDSCRFTSTVVQNQRNIKVMCHVYPLSHFFLPSVVFLLKKVEFCYSAGLHSESL